MLLNKEQIRRQFGRSAHSYDRVAGMQRRIVDELAQHLQPGCCNALDLGCGTGYGLRILENATRQNPTGLDLAPRMLELAALASPHARLVQGDIENLPFADAQFDLTFSSSALQWCDLGRAVPEIVRVTKPGGQLLLSTFIAGTLADWRRLWRISDSQSFVTYERFQAVLGNAGLSNPFLWRSTFRQRFTTFEDAVNSIRDLGAGNADRHRHNGLMGRRRFQTIKDSVNDQIIERGYVELPYEVAFACVTKGAFGDE